MTARRKRQPDSESAVYVGRDAAGTILIRDGQVTAIDADGEPLGAFKTDKEAMTAIVDAPKLR